MNPKQRENLAKYCYDLSKIAAAILVIGPLTRPEQMTIAGFVLSIAGVLVFLALGLLLDKGEEK